jgi:hypothetical protein
MSKAKKHNEKHIPTCDKVECVGCENGYCTILTDNQFKKDCPFFKNRDLTNEETANRRAQDGEMGS